jgi:putative transposase
MHSVEKMLQERGMQISHETVHYWWNRFGPMFAAELWRKSVDRTRVSKHRRWHLDEVFVKKKDVTHRYGHSDDRFDPHWASYPESRPSEPPRICLRPISPCYAIISNVFKFA